MSLVRVAMAALLVLLAAGACSGNAVTTAQPTGSPLATPTSVAGGVDTIVHLVALNISFDRQSIEVPAGKAFQIGFENRDASVPHNVTITGGGAELFKGEIFNGQAIRIYDVPPLAPGTYAFACSVHPNMTGTLSAK